METFLVLMVIVLAVWIAVGISKNEKKKGITYTVPSLYRPGSFCGALGSPGTSPEIVGRHHRNCECDHCLGKITPRHENEF